MIRSSILALALLLGGAGAHIEAKPLGPIDWKTEERLERMKDATRDQPLIPAKSRREIKRPRANLKGPRS